MLTEQEYQIIKNELAKRFVVIPNDCIIVRVRDIFEILDHFIEERNYWKKGLSRYLVEKIQELNPTLVQFETKAPEIVKCTIVLKDAVGKGVAICSILDEWEFNERKGRNIAAGRAVRALVNKTSDEVIRSQNFPDTWLLRQARRLLKYNQEECFKSQFGKIQ